MTEEKVYNYFKEFGYIIPQGSVMSSLGNHYKLASLSNCIVVPEMHDSYGGVFYTDQQLAQLFKRRCGVGVDISNLRPSGARVSNAAGSTSGAVSFMNRFSNTTREVAQNGRRGALMLSMDIAHPDVSDFITIKQDLQKVTGANISVRLSDEFMKDIVGLGTSPRCSTVWVQSMVLMFSLGGVPVFILPVLNPAFLEVKFFHQST